MNADSPSGNAAPHQPRIALVVTFEGVVPAGWLMNTAFFALAAALAAFSIAFGRRLQPPLRSRAAGTLFAVAALGILVSGVFESDPGTRAVGG